MRFSQQLQLSEDFIVKLFLSLIINSNAQLEFSLYPKEMMMMILFVSFWSVSLASKMKQFF